MPAISLRLRLMLIFLSLSLLTILSSGFLLLSNARIAIQNEVAASQTLTSSLISQSLGTVSSFTSVEQFLQTLPVKFRQVRHIRIRAYDRHGVEILAKPSFFFSQNGVRQNGEEASPAWFRSLLWTKADVSTIPIRLGIEQLGHITLTAEPQDEIDEIWTDIVILIKIGTCSLFALLLSIHFALGQALRPIGNISNGLKALETGHYNVRIPDINSPELARIGQGFNDLAHKLEKVYKEREKLSHRLVSVQDQERRHIAQELHDEFGPCLFGIKSNANSVHKTLQREAAFSPQAMKEKMQSVLDIVSHMENCNRDLLNRLRPMALGEIDLSELIKKLVATFQLRHNSIKWSLSLPDPLPSFGETIDLTIYRFIQESLTNVIKHAEATSVDIEIRQEQLIDLQKNNQTSQTELTMFVSDNGIGFSNHYQSGHGIVGLEERIEALGGKLSITKNQPHGVRIKAQILLTLTDKTQARLDKVEMHHDS